VYAPFDQLKGHEVCVGIGHTFFLASDCIQTRRGNVANEVGVENKVREAVKLLTELQDIDDELREIAMERGDLPEEVMRLQSQIGDSENYLVERRKELDETVQALTDQTAQLAEAKSKQEKLQQQLYAVKNTREYDAITAEANFAKESVSATESALASLERRKGELEQMIEAKKKELEGVRGEEQSKSRDLREKLAETEADERALLHRREGVVVQIMKPLFAHYERIRKAKDGRGVARIMDGACGGCFAVIPPQTQVNIRKQSDIVLCETCGRIIVP
jgi:uncharacterized protein